MVWNSTDILMMNRKNKFYELIRLGEKVLTLISKEQEAGENIIIWNATDFLGNTVSSGIYLYKIEAKSIITKKEYYQIKKLIYLK
jgi:flagellar hook assembly protein FlgD